ncbi:MAG: phosphotransferase [Propionibacteriales bacterium]|nr:phosphotransferase [Propionibacteriales bacterium]
MGRAGAADVRPSRRDACRRPARRGAAVSRLPDLQDALQDSLRADGLRLVTSVPRDRDHLLLELSDPAGETLAGQWHRDRARVADLAAQTRVVAPDAVTVAADGHVLVQASGADRRLPALARLASAPGARLVAHRAERRGVVRNADGSYTKVLRPGRLPAVVTAQPAYAGTRLRAPRVLAEDRAGGTLRMSALSGRTLHQLLADPSVPDSDIGAVGRAVGSALAALHAVPVTGLPTHDAAAEVAVTRRWLDHAAGYGLVDVTPLRRSLNRAMQRLAEGRPLAPAYLHRDLHDKQVVIEPGLPPGLLDFDLAAAGEAALDLANLLVHLELRSVQGRCSVESASRCAVAVVEGYGPSGAVLSRLPAYLLTTRIRLAAVYAFRPGSTGQSMMISTGMLPRVALEYGQT